MIRFQNPTILISAGVKPTQAFLSLIATTYMKCKTNSIAKREKIKRIMYDFTGVDARGCLFGYRC
jgi:hypothetical protein